MIDESENQRLKTEQTERSQEKGNNWRRIELVEKLMGWYLYGKADANMYGAPSPAGDEH